MEINPSLCFFMILAFAKCIEPGTAEYNEEDLVDPFDLLNYDRATKSMIRNPRKSAEGSGDGIIEMAEMSELIRCEQELNESKKQLLDLKNKFSSLSCEQNNICKHTDQPGNVKSSPAVEAPNYLTEKDCEQSKVYMKRFISVLLRASKLNEDMPLNMEPILQIRVTIEQLQTLQQFTRGSDISLQKLDHVLSSVISGAEHGIFSSEYIPWQSAVDFLQSREMLLAFVLGFLPTFLIWKLVRGHSVIRIMVMFLMSAFIISFSVTYCRMYKKAEIKQYAIIKQNPTIPVECRPPSELTWRETIFELFRTSFSFKTDTCHKYYEAVMLDPFLEVTPTLVLSEMAASFVLHPFGMLGSAVADFTNNILGNLPFGINYIVLLLSFLMIMALIIVSCGGVVKLPFLLGGAELSGRRPQERITAPEQTTQNIQLQQPQIHNQQIQHPVLNDTTISNLIQQADNTDTGFFITNAHGLKQLLSSGNIGVYARETVEQIRSPSPKKMGESFTYDEREQKLENEEEAHIPGCCGESRSKCHHISREEDISASEVQKMRRRRSSSHTEELRLKKPLNVSSKLEDKKRSPTLKKRSPYKNVRRTEWDEGIEVLHSESCSSCTGDSQALKSECNVEGPGSDECGVNFSRKCSVYNSEDECEETSFVKL